MKSDLNKLWTLVRKVWNKLVKLLSSKMELDTNGLKGTKAAGDHLFLIKIHKFPEKFQPMFRRM